jgi:hypothetical protein
VAPVCRELLTLVTWRGVGDIVTNTAISDGLRADMARLVGERETLLTSAQAELGPVSTYLDGARPASMHH